MRYWAVVYNKLPAHAMALYPLMIFKNEEVKSDLRIIRHEKIHFKQQIELLIIFFYPLYLLQYLFNLIKFREHHKAYMAICFEREAYANDNHLNYLNDRKAFAWVKFL